MKKIIFLFIIISLSLVQNTFGQIDCEKNLIIGKWKITNSLHWGIQDNIDSLRTISKGDTSMIGTIQFKTDSTYKITRDYEPSQLNGFYHIDTEKCEIILNRKKKKLTNKKAKERSNWEIIYIDKDILIYKEDNNPKGYATHILLIN